jgi:hypothetical protein
MRRFDGRRPIVVRCWRRFGVRLSLYRRSASAAARDRIENRFRGLSLHDRQGDCIRLLFMRISTAAIDALERYARPLLYNVRRFMRDEGRRGLFCECDFVAVRVRVRTELTARVRGLAADVCANARQVVRAE